jgi:hypothetical protein
MQTQIHDRSGLGLGGYNEGLKMILDAIAAADTAQLAGEAAEEVKSCGCPPGVCLGEIAEGLQIPADVTPPGSHASAEDHAAFGKRLTQMLVDTLPLGPNGEKPKVIFDGVYRGGERIDVPADEPASETRIIDGFGRPFDAQADKPIEAGERVFEPYTGAFDDMEDPDAFEKRVVVSQLVRGIENIGAAAAIAARLVEETFED